MRFYYAYKQNIETPITIDKGVPIDTPSSNNNYLNLIT
jgi:hypothetical protein